MTPPDRRAARWPTATAVLLGVFTIGCAPHATPLPEVAPAPAPASSCFLADTSTPSSDTLYVIDPRPLAAGATELACDGSHVLAAPLQAPNAVYATPATGTDLRDVLDRGLISHAGRLPDVVVTRKPDVLAYAEQSGRYTSHALPWDRTYVLAVPGADATDSIPTRARGALAREAVTSDARGATSPAWWASDATCAVQLFPPARDSRTIAYTAGDDIARQLAERMAALAGSSTAPAWLPAPLRDAPPRPWQVASVPADSMIEALARGRAAAGVYSYPMLRPQSCTGMPPIPLGGAILALVDSRAHALVRIGSGAAFFITQAGTLIFTRGRTQ